MYQIYTSEIFKTLYVINCQLNLNKEETGRERSR